MSRGALAFGVLIALSGGPRHGYRLASVLRAQGGFVRLQGGTLYPLVRRLEGQGLISHTWDTSESGPARKVLALTELGRVELEEARSSWAVLSRHLESLGQAERDDTEKGLA